MMVVTLYTSRVILQILGVDDYGIYILVAGFVSFFSFISRGLTTAIQRFLNTALGIGDKVELQKVFSISINIFILMSILIITIGETIGVWFVNSHLNIHESRMYAMNWVFQTSLLVFVVSIMRIPYNALIIAHERMDFFAYASIIEAILKLLIVFLLRIINIDKLILYSILFLCVTVIVNIIYYFYCKIEFSECQYKKVIDASLTSNLLSFSTWSMLGQIAVIGRGQGINYFINHYYSVSVNAAQGISNQVSGAMNNLVSNFQTAFNPQLFQTYASNEINEHCRLLYSSCKFSYYLLLMMVIPICFNMEMVLLTWLSVVPQYSIEFCNLGLISYLLLSLSSPLTTTIFANGNIKNYQISLMIIHSTDLLISMIVLKMGFVPYSIAIVNVFIQVVFLIIRFVFASKVSNINFSSFFNQVILPVCSTTILAMILPILFLYNSNNTYHTFVICIIDMIWVILIIYLAGLNKNEKLMINSKILQIIKKIQR